MGKIRTKKEGLQFNKRFGYTLVFLIWTTVFLTLFDVILPSISLILSVIFFIFFLLFIFIGYKLHYNER